MSKGLAVVYDRASTIKQSENYTRLDVKRIGQEIARRYGYDVEPEPRFEIKSGEQLLNRKVMLSIIEDIEAGKTADSHRVAAIIVPSFTRLSRDEDVVDGMVIKKTCKDNGVVVIDFNCKVYNFQNENDQDTALLEFWFASREKRQIINTMLRGQKEKAMQGKFMGGFAPFGYRIVLSGEVNKRGVPLKMRQIDPDEAVIIKEIYKLYPKMSALQIANKFNAEGRLMPIKNVKGIRRADHKETRCRPFCTTDIMRVINNPLYAGWFQWGTEHHYGRKRSKYLRDFEPQFHFIPELQIVSQEQYDRCQLVKSRRYDRPARAACSHYPFSQILKCRYCGSPLGGTIYRNGNQPKYRMHQYRCNAHYENRTLCPKGQQISAWPVAYALIPFMTQLIKEKASFHLQLERAANEIIKAQNQTVIEAIEKEKRSELEKVNLGTARLMDLIADGTLSRDEAKSKLQELRDRKERLSMEIRGYDERKELHKEVQESIKWIQGDLEQALWRMFEEKPQSLARIAKLIFKPHSVLVEAYWDTELKARSSHPFKRKARLVDYELNEDFRQLDMEGVKDLKLQESLEPSTTEKVPESVKQYSRKRELLPAASQSSAVVPTSQVAQA